MPFPILVPQNSITLVYYGFVLLFRGGGLTSMTLSPRTIVLPSSLEPFSRSSSAFSIMRFRWESKASSVPLKLRLPFRRTNIFPPTLLSKRLSGLLISVIFYTPKVSIVSIIFTLDLYNLKPYKNIAFTFINVD